MSLKIKTFEKHEVRDYERKRYRGLDQRLVHARENRILKKMLNKTGTNFRFALDIPCGYGRFSGLLQEKYQYLVHCDLSFHMVDRAKEQAQRHGQSLGWGVVSNAKQGLSFQSDTFDLLFSLRFFHHIHEKKDREFIMKEFARLSAGTVILSYYQMNFLHRLQRKFRRKLKKSSTKIKMISSQELQRVAGLAGLKIVKVSPLFRGLHSQHIALLKKRD